MTSLGVGRNSKDLSNPLGSIHSLSSPVTSHLIQNKSQRSHNRVLHKLFPIIYLSPSRPQFQLHWPLCSFMNRWLSPQGFCNCSSFHLEVSFLSFLFFVLEFYTQWKYLKKIFFVGVWLIDTWKFLYLDNTWLTPLTSLRFLLNVHFSANDSLTTLSITANFIKKRHL